MRCLKFLLKPSLLACVIFGSTLAIARPVSYPGGWTVMQQNNKDFNQVHLHYSPTAKYSIGYLGEYRREPQWQFHAVQLNYLAKRWNRRASQANLYIKSGLGYALSDLDEIEGEEELGAFFGIAADWEDRRFFTSYENRYYDVGSIDRFFSQRARLGVAPYVGDYGDLHTWLMVQFDHQPELDDSFTVTPLVRLFKSEYLVELGVTDQGEGLLNFVVRY